MWNRLPPGCSPPLHTRHIRVSAAGDLEDPLMRLYFRAKSNDPSRDIAIRRYGFAIVDARAIAAIGAWARNGLVELGAGTGYTAALLNDYEIDVVAFDLDPPPSPTNRWFAGTTPWFDVQRGDETVVDDYTDRCLMLVWPTMNETWAADAVERFHAGGGERVVFVGEGPGGHSGDDRFHAMIGTLHRCYRCAYGLLEPMCVCEVPRLYNVRARVPIPHWDGFRDSVYLLERRDPHLQAVLP
jgi:hypothetical protein